MYAICGCGKEQPKTVSALGNSAKTEHAGKNTRVTITGPGGEHVIEIKPAAAMKHIGIPPYPGATAVPHSQHLTTAKDTGDRTYSARFRTKAGFDRVVKWYEARLKTSAISSKIVGTRRALIAKTDWARGRVHSVLVTRSAQGNTTDFTLMLVLEKR